MSSAEAISGARLYAREAQNDLLTSPNISRTNSQLAIVWALVALAIQGELNTPKLGGGK